MSAIPSHSTATTDAEWDGPTMKGRLPSARAALRAANAWVDAEADPDTKTAYKFIHHMVSGSGEVGAANVRGCTSAIGVLNGGRGGTTIPDADKDGVWRHLARHLRDAGVEEVPELRGAAAHPIATRAYSVFRVKQIDDDRRIITGIATTPSTDRVGDIIEPLGITFTNPIPLLLYHDSRAPVGQARLNRPTDEGVTFTAQIAKVGEPGRLQERVDEAWQSIKAGLVRGVSIGFRVLNDAMDWMKDTGGFRYRETEILELSLVAIPANQDATIGTIKALDAPRLAAPGTAPRVSVTPSGAADIITGHHRMNHAEELTQKLADLRAKTDRLEALRQAATDTAPSDADLVERKGLTAEIEALHTDIGELRAIEKAAMSQLVPIRKAVPADAAPAPTVEVKSMIGPGIEFSRLLICKAISVLSRGEVPALEVARHRYPDNPRIQAELKAAVAGATTTDSTWAGPLMYPTTLAAEFVEYLRPMTIVGRIPNLRRVPFNVRILGQTTGAAAGWVGQGKLKPLSKFDIAVNTTMTPAKIAAIAVFSDEIGRFSSPSIETLIRDELARAIVERMDTDFVDPSKAAVSNVSPASITNGLSALTPSGTDAAAVRADLAQLLQTFIDANNPPTSAVVITSNTVALNISLMTNALGQPEFPNLTMTGGTLRGIPVITSQYAAIGSPASNLLILLNAGDLFLADDGGVAIDVSREASLEMESDPENQSGTVVSMFQSNQLALRAERYINWAKRRASAVAYLDGVAYAAGSPA